nr:OmpA family protein [Vibrio ostreicida]
MNINISSTLFTFVATTLVLSTNTFAEDVYDYIDTPVPNQLADLRDQDKDGVINARDLCADTPLGAEIDNEGCGTYVNSEQEMDLHILFENDSSDVQPLFLTQIRQMADFLDTYPEASIELQGYASKVGQHQHNLALSKRRATEVQSALVNNGIDPTRISIVGFGDTNLSETGDDELTHAKNRKVIASVVGYKGNVKKQWTIFTKKPK